jgi:hypothetical protein
MPEAAPAGYSMTEIAIVTGAEATYAGMLWEISR